MLMRWRWPPENSCGIARQGGSVEADGGEQFGEARGEARGGRFAVDGEGLGEDLADGHARD